METVSLFTLSALLNAAWQIPLVVVVAAACARTARWTPARYRYVTWVGALALAVALPLASAWLATSRHGADGSSSDRVATAASPVAHGTSGGPLAWFTSSAAPHGSLEIPPRLTWALLAAYAAFAAYRSIRFGRAWARARALRNDAECCPAPRAVESAVSVCVSALGLTGATIRVSDRVALPSTVGLLRPVIILPRAFLHIEDQDTLLTAIGHELVHVRRKDFALNLVCELLALPFAFHPAVSFLGRRIRESRELACDEGVAECILPGRSYARALVGIAHSAPLAGAPGYNLGVFDANILEERVMRLMDDRPRASARSGRIFSVAALAVLLLASTAASAYSIGIRSDAATQRQMVGQWNLFISNDDAKKANANDDAVPGLVSIDFDGSKLVGTATVWHTRKTEDGRTVGDDSKKMVFTLVDPTFDGSTFRFSVFNGEEKLVGELKLDGDVLVGRWSASKSKESGSLRMTRK